MSESSVSLNDTAVLKETVASTLGLETNEVLNLAIEVTLATSRRRLQASYLWTLTFEVAAHSGDSSSEDPSDYALSLQASLISDLAANVESALDIAVTIEGVTTVVETRKPTSLPSAVPSEIPSALPSAAPSFLPSVAPTHKPTPQGHTRAPTKHGGEGGGGSGPPGTSKKRSLYSSAVNPSSICFISL